MVADPAAGPAKAKRRRWWLIGAATGWALVIIVLALVSVRTSPPSVPDQVDLSDVVPAVDRAAAAVLVAAGPAAVVAIGTLDVAQDCALTPVRDGYSATREVTVHVRPGDGPATLDAIAAALPASYGADAAASRSGARHVLYADAGEFVAVRATVDAETTLVKVRASTGCRGRGNAVVLPPIGTVPPAALDAAWTALALTGPDASLAAANTRQIPCPGGGTARTAVVQGHGKALDALEPLTSGAIVVEADRVRYAYRTGGASVVAENVDGLITLAGTTGC